ncbi:MAG: Flp pilus assembly protein CpaB [Pseudomonadota bacterium]
MKVARMAVVSGALLASVGAGYLAFSLSAREPVVQTVESDRPTISMEQVLVASADISLGSSLKPGSIRWQEWPSDAVGRGFVTQASEPDALDSFDGAIARAVFYEGEPIRESKLVRSDRGYMSAILPSGQRAIATTISTETSAGGFILPNDRVDVIMTRRHPGSENGDYVTETILENIRVLAIDQTVEEQDGESVVVGETATLQLTPRQAEVLTVAQQMADRLALTLRSIEDSKNEKTSAAYHLIGGERGAGTVRVIKYGGTKDVLVGTNDKAVE